MQSPPRSNEDVSWVDVAQAREGCYEEILPVVGGFDAARLHVAFVFEFRHW